MKELLLMPSFYAHILNGIFILIAVLILFTNYSKIMKSGSYNFLILLLLFSITFGLHGISHLGLEQNYNFYPLSIFKSS